MDTSFSFSDFYHGYLIISFLKEVIRYKLREEHHDAVILHCKQYRFIRRPHWLHRPLIEDSVPLGVQMPVVPVEDSDVQTLQSPEDSGDVQLPVLTTVDQESASPRVLESGQKPVLDDLLDAQKPALSEQDVYVDREVLLFSHKPILDDAFNDNDDVDKPIENIKIEHDDECEQKPVDKTKKVNKEIDRSMLHPHWIGPFQQRSRRRSRSPRLISRSPASEDGKSDEEVGHFFNQDSKWRVLDSDKVDSLHMTAVEAAMTRGRTRSRSRSRLTPTPEPSMSRDVPSPRTRSPPPLTSNLFVDPTDHFLIARHKADDQQLKPDERPSRNTSSNPILKCWDSGVPSDTACEYPHVVLHLNHPTSL